jgi:hypothetical protein
MNRILSFALAFLVFFTACQKEVSVESGTPSAGSLQNTAGDCMPKNVGGNFIANKVLNDSNFIEVSVDVAVPGSYTIFTDTVNGYYFRGQGSFANAGTATVKLKGNGKPLVAGTDNFLVIYDSTFCSIDVTVLPAGSNPPPAGSGLYFPLSNNSWWSYDDGSADTVVNTVKGTTTLNGKTYSRFVLTDDFGTSDTAYYRLDATTKNYYQYVSTDAFAGLPITFTQPFLDILFMKEVLATNATWNSDHAGTLSGIPFTLRFKFTCINNNETLTINGKNFTNVYHIRLQGQAGTFGTFTDSGDPQEFYYAKGIGWIKFSDPVDQLNIRNWLVN